MWLWWQAKISLWDWRVKVATLMLMSIFLLFLNITHYTAQHSANRIRFLGNLQNANFEQLSNSKSVLEDYNQDCRVITRNLLTLNALAKILNVKVRYFTICHIVVIVKFLACLLVCNWCLKVNWYILSPPNKRTGKLNKNETKEVILIRHLPIELLFKKNIPKNRNNKEFSNLIYLIQGFF